MCLVEIENTEKLVIACLTDVESDINILTDTLSVKKARENVLEFLLLNHPLDCPICDQAGECDLQDQTKIFGNYINKIFSKRRGVEDKYCGSFIKTIMTRCIHCTRCVRFGAEIVGTEFFGTLNRGNSTEIGSYIENIFDSNISGNVIDLCPVGALTSKPYAFKTRPWELRSMESIDLTDSLGSQIFVNYKESSVLRILPKSNNFINGNLISDIARFSYDSLNNNRIYNIYNIDKNKNLKQSNWDNFFKKLKTLKNQKFLFLINEQLDLKTINNIKFLSFLYNNIKLRSYIRFNEFTNFYGFFKPIETTFINKNNKFCILIGTNLKTENAIINTKIRLQSLECNYKLYCLGSKYDSNISTFFISLHSKEIMSFLEGKKKMLVHHLYSSYSPYIILGEGFKKRFSNLDNLLQNFKKFNFSIKNLIINSASNTEGNFFFNIKSLTLKDFNISKYVYSFYINDNINFRRLIVNLSNTIIHFNTHFISTFYKNSVLIPISSNYFENSGIYINSYQNIQKTQKIFSPVNNLKDITFILNNLFSKNKFNVSYLNFITETIQLSKSFVFKKKKFSEFFLKNLFLKNSINLISFYPMKFFLNNLSQTDTFLKNSYFLKKK